MYEVKLSSEGEILTIELPEPPVLGTRYRYGKRWWLVISIGWMLP